MQVTAGGSLPGEDFRGALGAMAEALPEMIPLPELPARGVASFIVGRALGLISGLHFDLQPAGWRLANASDADHRRARSQWRFDLDDTEELLQGFTGTLKVAVAGPLTLAASVERPMGGRLLADHGARRELSQALSDSVASLFADLAQRLPETTLLLQVDEPLLVPVATGQVPTASGFSRHRRIDDSEMSASLALLSSVDPAAILHCCVAGDWLPLAARAGFAGVSVDTSLFEDPRLRDRIGQWLADGGKLVAGIVDTAQLRIQKTDELVTHALAFLRPLQLDPELLCAQVTLGTACGLAGWAQQDVLPQLAQLRRCGELIDEQLAR